QNQNGRRERARVGRPLLWAPVLRRVPTFRDPPYLFCRDRTNRVTKRGTVAVVLRATSSTSCAAQGCASHSEAATVSATDAVAVQSTSLEGALWHKIAGRSRRPPGLAGRRKLRAIMLPLGIVGAKRAANCNRCSKSSRKIIC